MTRRELLNESRPHLAGAIINAVVAIGSGANNARQAAKNNQDQKSTAAMQNLPKGGTSDFQPTALAQQAKDASSNVDQMGLQDLVKKQDAQQGGGMQMGGKFSEAGQPPAGTEQDFHLKTSALDVPQNTFQQPQQPQQAPAQQQGLSNGQYIQLAQAAGGLASSLAQRPNAPGAQIPQAGNMNFQPTALAQLARRGPY